MLKHKWTKTLILAGLLALPATASMAATVEMVIIPCTPQLRPDECGVKLSVTSGSATFTSNSGQSTTVTGGNSLTVSGTGVVTQSTGSVVNFAAVAGAVTTGSVGGGGGGAGQTNPTPSGGPNNGPSGPTGNTPTGNTPTGNVTVTTGPSLPTTPVSP